MKYIVILLALATISCGSIETEAETPVEDSVKIDSVDERTEAIDTVKKKSVKMQ